MASRLLLTSDLVGSIKAPKMSMPQSPEPVNREYAALHGERDFPGVLKVMDFEMRRLFWILQVNSLIP